MSRSHLIPHCQTGTSGSLTCEVFGEGGFQREGSSRQGDISRVDKMVGGGGLRSRSKSHISNVDKIGGGLRGKSKSDISHAYKMVGASK